MPHYKSITGKEVVVRLGKDKHEIRITTKPTFSTHPNLQKIIPKYVIKVDNPDAENPTFKGYKVKDLETIVQKEAIRQNPQPFKELFIPGEDFGQGGD